MNGIRRTEGLTGSFIVRSNARDEDGKMGSQAGRYLSCLNVHTNAELIAAINDVFASYGQNASDGEVFVQPMLQNVVTSGVIITHDPISGPPYVVVEYARSENTTVITSGSKEVTRFVYLRCTQVALPVEIAKLEDVVFELINILAEPALDIEFAVDRRGDVFLFQVRPLASATTVSSSQPALDSIEPLLLEEADRIASVMDLACHRLGTRTIFGTMPDWNPAELIGLKPRPLAVSLYSFLVTDESWAEARRNYGYRDMRGIPLMHLFAGTPYIDVAASLLSFIPSTVPDGVAIKIASAALEYLEANHDLHDKIEFAVIPTCYSTKLSGNDWQQRFASLTRCEWINYVQALRTTTADIICDGGLYDRSSTRASSLAARGKLVSSSPQPSLLDVLGLLETARAEWMPLFGEVARAAFIAIDIAKAFEAGAWVPTGFVDRLIAGTPTITRSIVTDFHTLKPSDFLKRHGHMRPGTYDIRTPRYDEAPSRYCKTLALKTDRPDRLGEYDLDDQDLGFAGLAVFELSLGVDVERFIKFARSAIACREEVKYNFCWYVSNALQMLTSIGERCDLSRDDLSFLGIGDIQQVASLADRRQQHELVRVIARNKARWASAAAIRTPDLLADPASLFAFECIASSPTYVSSHVVEADVATPEHCSLGGKIILLEQADPGYDWLFTQNIAGLVTAYGGENSHMAIRAREFGIAAVLGSGHRFAKYAQSRRLRIDPVNQRIDIIQ